jgi:Cys-tRNA(Pro)/Cys-tRNA(Cys) deacylase
MCPAAVGIQDKLRVGRLKKNPAIRLLESRRIPFEIIRYPETIHNAVELAEYVGLPPARVYKTLVVLPSGPDAKPWLVMLPGPATFDLKGAAAELGLKRLRMATRAEAENLTGLRAGGISALALPRRSFHVFLSGEARQLAWVAVSAGQRGLNIKLAVEDLRQATGAAWLDIAADPALGQVL